MAELPLVERGFEELEEDQVLGRKYEGFWEKECSDEQLERAFAVFWPSGDVPICNDTGLPNRLVENRFWDVIGRLWRATYFKKKASLFDEKLFQRFLNEQVVERKEADWNVSLYIRICGSLHIRENGWDQLMRLARFLSQHGRLTQPL
jgi:hypothetical protein